MARVKGRIGCLIIEGEAMPIQSMGDADTLIDEAALNELAQVTSGWMPDTITLAEILEEINIEFPGLLLPAVRQVLQNHKGTTRKNLEKS